MTCDIPEDVARRRFTRSWANFRDLYREIADDWQVYDNSGEAAVLLAQSEGWQEVREPRPDPDYRDHEHKTAEHRRRVMAKQQFKRFPEGEPSVRRVLAALKLARQDAMAREEAVRKGEPVQPPHHGPWEGYEVDAGSREESD